MSLQHDGWRSDNFDVRDLSDAALITCGFDIEEVRQSKVPILWNEDRTEHICNLFLFVQNGLIRFIGARWHELDGTDESKLAFLQEEIANDLPKCKQHLLPDDVVAITADGLTLRGAISYQAFQELAGSGLQMSILERTVFKHYDFCPQSPLMVATPVVDGVITIQGIHRRT